MAISTRVLASVFRTGFHPGPLIRSLNGVPSSRALSTLPAHEVVGLPALSPTMERGTIAEWLKAPGDEISAGDIVCQIETDKATVDFEAQDESVLAKIIVNAGSEVEVGAPICVMVEETDDVAAFADFKLEEVSPQMSEDNAESKTDAAHQTAPSPVAATPTPPPTVVEAPEPVVVEAPEPVVVEAAEPVVTGAAPDASTPYMFKRWGTHVSSSPIAKKMAEDQLDYVSKYGSTLQVPISK